MKFTSCVYYYEKKKCVHVPLMAAHLSPELQLTNIIIIIIKCLVLS